MFIENQTSKAIRPKPYRVSRSELAFRARETLRLVDYLTLGYLALMGTLVLLFHRHVPNWPLHVAGHYVSIGLLFLFFRFATGHRSRLIRFVRDAYPFFLYTFMFKETSTIINIFFPFWLEPFLIKWDLALLGSHPTVWLQRFYHPWLTEFMAFSYWSYYILLPAGALILYLRKDKVRFHSLVFTLSLTLYLCYFSYLLLTARGPHETLAYLHADRQLVGFFDRLVHAIQARAAISGAAFPSSHVAAVWVVLFFMFEHRKWLGFAMLPLVLSLTVSVVYLQYHYAVDPLAGILVAVLVFLLARFIQKRANPKIAKIRDET
ncbi:MAG: hypothetical protein D6743_03500 [Calditrichaeota bacterium]|nr:MAG: hypothetical protein D6743_03500 [Calditrichota bacterium]